jgi:mRNA interferase HigB
MWIVSHKKLRDFWAVHPEAQGALQAWYDAVSDVEWTKFDDIRALYRKADQVGSCIVFNIKGNHYRLIATISKGWKKVYIREVLTHKEYDSDKWKVYCGSQ